MENNAKGHVPQQTFPSNDFTGFGSPTATGENVLWLPVSAAAFCFFSSPAHKSSVSLFGARYFTRDQPLWKHLSRSTSMRMGCGFPTLCVGFLPHFNGTKKKKKGGWWCHVLAWNHGRNFLLFYSFQLKHYFLTFYSLTFDKMATVSCSTAKIFF